MADLIVPNIICFHIKKQLATLNNIRVLLKSVLIDSRARNFVHAKTFLCARCVQARHRARNLSSPDKAGLFEGSFFFLGEGVNLTLPPSYFKKKLLNNLFKVC